MLRVSAGQSAPPVAPLPVTIVFCRVKVPPPLHIPTGVLSLIVVLLSSVEAVAPKLSTAGPAQKILVATLPLIVLFFATTVPSFCIPLPLQRLVFPFLVTELLFRVRIPVLVFQPGLAQRCRIEAVQGRQDDMRIAGLAFQIGQRFGP